MIPERLTSRFIVAPSGCWIWLRRLHADGYGLAPTGRRGSGQLAHRAVYEAAVGGIPPGLELGHLCRVRRCVNPMHLQPVSHAENARRGRGGQVNRRKTACPAGHPYAADNLERHSLTLGRRECIVCRRASERRRKADRTASGQASRKARAQYRHWQGDSLDSATRRGAHWTGPEYELLLRDDLTVRDVARITHRTYRAVQAARQLARKGLTPTLKLDITQ